MGYAGEIASTEGETRSKDILLRGEREDEDSAGNGLYAAPEVRPLKFQCFECSSCSHYRFYNSFTVRPFS